MTAEITRLRASLASAEERVGKLEVVLKKHSCSCPGPCERTMNNRYAEPDMCCEAHDAMLLPDTGKPDNP